ncbi:MAG: tetratricopeptide repeat protein, partial [bacterium]|nr:tetratricopeptide repeat protein [bacterium]
KYIHSEEIRNELKKAHLLRCRERYFEAQLLLITLLDKYPDDPVILNNLGNVYLSEGRDYDEAEKCFLEAYQKAPELMTIPGNLSRLYAKTGKYEKAAEYARRVLTLAPKSPKAWNTLGLFYARQGKLATALDYFLASYSYDETYYTGAYNAACALAGLKRFDEALRYLEMSLVEESSYLFAKTDETLAPLRELDEYKRMMDDAAQRFGKRPSGKSNDGS